MGSGGSRCFPRQHLQPQAVSRQQPQGRPPLPAARTGTHADPPYSDVINRGLGGYNTEWGLEAFKQARRELACGSSLRRMLTPLVGTTQYFPKKAERSFKIQLVTIWWGANDATLPGQIQHVPLDAFVQNIREMVSLIRDPASPYHSPETSIILINAPPFFQEHWLDTKAAAGGPREQDRDDEVTRQYAEAVKQLGAELGLPVADAYTAVTATNHREGLENPKAIWWDGLHLTGLAYRAVTGGASRGFRTE